MEFLNEIGLYGQGSSSSSSSSALTDNANAFRKFTVLEENKPYRLSCVELINTKFGKKLALKLIDEAGIFFLPSRFQNLSQERKNEILKLKDIDVLYRGERKFNAFKNTTPLIEFSFIRSSSDDRDAAAVATLEVEEQEEKPKKKKKYTSNNS